MPAGRQAQGAWTRQPHSQALTAVNYHKYLIYNKSLIDPEAALSEILLISLCLLPDSCLHYNFRPFVHSGQKPKEALNESELP